MDFHNTSLDLHEFMQDLLDRGKELEEDEPKTIYYIEAFIDDRRQWTEYATDEEEREKLINQAVAAGFTYTVETEIQ